MARLPRLAPVGIAQHVIQRGNNRQPNNWGQSKILASNSPSL